MSLFSDWVDGVLDDMETDKALREVRQKQLYMLEQKGEQMAKFLYPQAVVDAFREYAEEVSKMFVLMDKELARPIVDEFIKNKKEKENE